MWYTFALFVHILGSIGLFIAVSLVVVAFVRMRRAATLEQMREWAAVANLAGKSIIFISLIVLAPALYMVIIAWGFATSWVLAALITFIVLSVMGATMNGRNIERIFDMAQVTSSTLVSDELRSQLMAPQLWLAESIRLTLLIGILALMTIKPDMLFSLLILVGMLILGIILGTISQRSLGRVSQKKQLV
ncbi:MAG: hypothetical protein ACR2H5_04280 [Ktedonobacteraceae bacterium]